MPRSEFDFIERVRRRTARRPAPAGLARGIGDDAAVWRARPGFDNVVTTDLLVEDVDFRLSTAEPGALGHKALAVSLSDIAAMGARPRFALLSVGVTAGVWAGSFLEKFYEGFFRLAASHGVALVGGDVSRTPERVVVDSIVIGEVRRGRAVLRGGAREGDLIFVTGALGGAAAGLGLLESRARRAGGPRRRLGAAERELVERQTRPAPRVEWGALLGGRGLATAMLDLSDGLSSDLGRLCRESRVGALVEAELLPVHPRLRGDSAAGSRPPRAPFAESALALATHGGEDFELLFTVRPRDAAKLPRALGGVPVTRIGEIRPRRFGLKIARAGRADTLRPEGFDHFALPG